MKIKPYQVPQDSPDFVSEPSPSAIMQQREIRQLRHHVMDAVYASDDKKILHFCLVLLRRKSGESKNKQLFMIACPIWPLSN